MNDLLMSTAISVRNASENAPRALRCPRTQHGPDAGGCVFQIAAQIHFRERGFYAADC
jgi:hypothetical protein